MLGFSINTERIVYEMLCFWHDVCHTFIIIQFKIYPNFQCDCLWYVGYVGIIYHKQSLFQECKVDSNFEN